MLKCCISFHFLNCHLNVCTNTWPNICYNSCQEAPWNLKKKSVWKVRLTLRDYLLSDPDLNTTVLNPLAPLRFQSVTGLHCAKIKTAPCQAFIPVHVKIFIWQEAFVRCFHFPAMPHLPVGSVWQKGNSIWACSQARKLICASQLEAFRKIARRTMWKNCFRFYFWVTQHSAVHGYSRVSPTVFDATFFLVNTFRIVYWSAGPKPPVPCGSIQNAVHSCLVVYQPLH